MATPIPGSPPDGARAPTGPAARNDDRVDCTHDRRRRRRPHLLLLDRALAGRRGRDRRAQRRRRHRLLDLASGVLAHRAGTARQPLRGHHAARPSTSPTYCSRLMPPRRRSMPRRSAPSSRQQYQNANVDPDEIDTGALILTGVAVRRRNARRDRRAVCAPSRKDGGGLGRRQPGDRDGRPRLGRGGTLDPRQGDGDERGRGRRHLEDRGLRRRPGHRADRARRRRASGVPRPGWQDRARRGSRAPLRRRARHQPRARSAACARGGARIGGRHGGGAVRGDARASAGGRRRRAAAARSAVDRRGDRAGHVLGRRRRIHLWPRGNDLRRSRRGAGAGNPDPGRRPGGRGSSARTKASARP